MAKNPTPHKITKDAKAEDVDYLTLAAPHRKMHYLHKPVSFNTAVSWTTLDHQVRYSVQVLERELNEQGNPHILQLELDPQSYLDNPNLTIQTWTLYADGLRVAHGEGSFARECFEKSADEFLNVCRQAVLAADLQKNSVEEYELLRKVRNIAERAANGAEH